MLRAVAGRVVFAIILVVVAFTAAFLVTALAPGELSDEGPLTQAQITTERRRLGLDQPVVFRLARRLAAAAMLDFGESSAFNRPVLPLLIERTTSTLAAGLPALALAILAGIPLGVLASRTRHRWLRGAIAAVSVLLLSTPALVMALLLTVLGSSFGLPPFAVMTVALALPAAALLERLQARAMVAALDDTCLRAAEARGLPRTLVTWRHAWPLSLSGVLGVASIVASHLLSGALAVELITTRPGLGLLTLQALLARDANLAAACAGMAALLVGLVTLAGDVVQLSIDPRLRAADLQGRAGALPASPAEGSRA